MPHKSSKSANESTEKCDSRADFAVRFKSFRDSSGLKQSDLAALLDAHPNYISQIERGEKVPGRRLIKDFRTLEDSPAYKTTRNTIESPARETQSMPPPHSLSRSTKQGDDGKKSPLENYAEAVSILGDLLEKKPEALEAMMFTLRAVHKTLKG